MDARWSLTRASESGAVAMDVKWLLGRAGKSGATAVSRGKSGQSYAGPLSYPYWPMLVLLYTADLVQLVESFGLYPHLYADGTQNPRSMVFVDRVLLMIY